MILPDSALTFTPCRAAGLARWAAFLPEAGRRYAERRNYYRGGALALDPASAGARGRSSRGGSVRIIACIEDPKAIEKILDHRKEKMAPEPLTRLPAARAPPGLFG